MPFLGAHMSIAGGLHLCFDRIEKVKGEALQIFSRNQRQWQSPEITPEERRLFDQKRKAWGDFPIAVHTSYLLNLAAVNADTETRSIEGLALEFNRAALLKIPYIIMHPGSHLGAGRTAGLKKLAANIDKAFKLSGVNNVTLLLETTAGQGTSLGARFEDLAAVLELSRYEDRLGICFDTCHVYAAGYDIATEKGYAGVFERFEALIGIRRLKFFHLNDSQKGMGSRVDRHEHIGKGDIGLKGFELLLNDARFKDHPMTLETPKTKELQEDIANLRILRKLMHP